MKTEFKN